MKKRNDFAPSLLLFILALLQLFPTHALKYESFNGYQIKDLTSTDLATFAFETQGWTISGLSGSANSSLCGLNNPVLAGFDTFSNSLGLSKTYSALPTHTAVYYQITFNFIDKFKNPDYVTLTLGLISITSGTSLKTYNSYVTSNICGGSDSDTTQFMITGSIPHTAATLPFQLTAKASTGSGSGTLGIRDIQLTFVNDSSITSSTSCLRVYDTQLFGLPGECPCVKGSYSNAGSCSSCDPSCTDCSGPSASQCYGCAVGFSWNGSQCIQCDSSCLTCTGTGELQCVTCKNGYWLQANGSCTATCDLPVSARQAVGSLQVCYSSCTTSQYLLWDGSCANNCSFPLLVVGTSGSNQLCNKPCQTGEYLYWNGSCISGCATPLVSSSLNSAPICSKPCQNTEYLYWNNSCIATCSYPLISSTSNGLFVCNQPCQTGEYLYWNSSCISGCATPLVSSSLNSAPICSKPCQNTEYLYWNSSCLGGCLAPFVSSISGEVSLCNKPCQNNEYLNWNNSCIASCSHPLILSTSNGLSVCNRPCQNSEYLYWNSSCLGDCLAPFVASTSGGVLYCDKPCQNSEYLYWNSSCVATCLHPLISSTSNGFSVCNQPCQNSEYLYWNSSCLGDCLAPFVISTSGGVLYCDKPCQNSEYLYWNNSCIAACSYPFTSATSNGLSVCNQPCQNSEYLYWNSSCLGGCTAPFVSSTSGEVSLCNKPCQNSEYLYWNNSCIATCSHPLISSTSNGLSVCNQPCQTGEYLYWNGSCISGCATPLVSSSLNSALICSKPCQNSEYLYWNNSCITTCSYPFISSTSNGLSICKQPCQNNEYLYQNGSCLSTCSSPFVSSSISDVLICNQPCQNSEYLYWNNSCLTNCPTPLISSSFSNGSFCNKPCENNGYLSWNGSCISGCPSPLISSDAGNGVLLCQKPCLNNQFLYPNASCLLTCSSPYTQSSLQDVDLCQLPCVSSSQFLYPNGSCLAQCQIPLVSNTVNGIKRCSSPCASQSEYYYTENNSCEATCLSPNTIHTVEFIKTCSINPTTIVPETITKPTKSGDLSNEDKKFVDQTKAVTETTGKTTSIGVIASSLLSPHGTNAITLVSLVKMLEYIRYINVDYPAKLQYMLDSEKKSSISMNFDVELPENIQEKFPNEPLPGKFGEYELKSSFILNYSEALFTFALLLLVLAISMALAPLLQNVKFLGLILGKIRDIIKWNFFLIVLCENIESVGVYSSLEFRTTHFNSFVSVFGTLVCCFVNLLILYLILIVPYVIYSLRRRSRKVLPLTNEIAKPEEEKNNRFEACGVLFMNFKEKSVWQHLCMFFILIRVYLFYLIIGYLFEYPLTQAILITLMSVLMLGYLSISRPFRNKLELLKNITYESIIALVNLCVLILTIIEHKNVENEGIKTRLGDVIIMANTTFNVMALLFLIAEVIERLVKAYKLRKTIKEKGWKYWTKIASILLQPEEMEDHHESHSAKPGLSSSVIAQNKAVTFKQQKLVETDSIFDSQILDIRRPNSPSLTRVPSIKSRIFPSQSISSLNGFLPSTKSTMNLLPQGGPSPSHQESQSRPNSYRTLLSSSQEFDLQKFGNESPPTQMNGISGKSKFVDVLSESARGMNYNKRILNKRKTFLAANENLIDSSFEGEVGTPKSRSLVITPRNLKISSMKSNFKPN